MGDEATLSETGPGSLPAGCLKGLVWQGTFVGCVPAKRTTLSKLGFFPLTHRTHSMIFKCFVSQPLSMENRGDQAMIATGSFEERDTFREA